MSLPPLAHARRYRFVIPDAASRMTAADNVPRFRMQTQAAMVPAIDNRCFAKPGSAQ
jgi:hypothetical protein